MPIEITPDQITPDQITHSSETSGPSAHVRIVTVFSAGPGGGNPAPVVIDAGHMSAEAMRATAALHGHESAFVLPDGGACDFRFRFFVPNHEMEMCGHATIGATWLLARLGLLPAAAITIATLSGPVRAEATTSGARVSQPKAHADLVAEPGPVLEALRLQPADLAELPLLNAATSRIKTLVPLRSREALDALQPDFAKVAAACDAVGSTGLYPFAAVDGGTTFAARQFPRRSGYPEDAATGIAAAALAWSLRHLGSTSGDHVIIRQGEAMGRPSEIVVSFEEDVCWISGRAELVEHRA